VDARALGLRVAVLSARRAFSFITVQAQRLLVGVFLEQPLDSSRAVKIDHVSVRKVGSVVEVRGAGHVDDELQRWLRHAYELGTQPVRTSR
jgi:hypothetical protein